MRKLPGFFKRIFAGRQAGLSASALVGRRGEKEAARFLKGKGYKVLARNYRITQGEIDLVAFRDGVLAFVEVRAQTQPGLFDPLYTITRRKQRHIIEAAQTYTSLNDLQADDVLLRFDVVTVLFDARSAPWTPIT
ncbi:MAG: YraN family protein [Candidatus Brocadiae bacterium]|nr:YraN family protein [Candidatus Brocadiia bacterium]